MATVADVQAAFNDLEAQTSLNESTEGSAASLLENLGDIIEANQNDPAVLQVIADGLRNRTGTLKQSADSLAAAIVANTPAA